MNLDEYFDGNKTIKIPSKVKKFFLKKGKYLNPNNQHPRFRYESILGKKYEPIPKEFEEEEYLQTKDTTQIKNQHLEMNQINETIYALFKKMDLQIPGKEIQRSFMLNGATVPIRVSIGSHKHPHQQVIFVKRPNFSRLIGKTLYNIIQEEKQDFVFNEHLFVETRVPGEIVKYANEEILLFDEKYRINFAKAAARAEFLGMIDDTLPDKNRIVDDKLNTKLFDFDIIFEVDEGKKYNKLMTEYNKWYLESAKQLGFIGSFTTAAVAKSYQDEKKQIAKLLIKNNNQIKELSDLLGEVEILDYEFVDSPKKITLNNKLQKYFGMKNLREYTNEFIYKFGK